MRLHLPKMLLTALLAVCVAMPPVYAEDSGGTSSTITASTDLSYAGTIYTMDETALNNTLSAMYETTLVSADGDTPADWRVEETASDETWSDLYATDDFNTLRIDVSTAYTYTFNELSFGGLIVEDGVTSSFTANTGGTRDIFIGKDGLTANSYFGGSFTIDNTKGNSGSEIHLKGTQTWYIADDKTVTLNAKNGVINTGSWTVNGGTVQLNGTVTNTNGTINASNGAVFAAASKDVFDLQRNYSYGETNAAIDVENQYTVIDGGTSHLESIYIGENTINLTDGSYFTESAQGYGVVESTNVSTIKSSLPGNCLFIAIKEGATLTADDTFTTAQKLIGAGKYDLGEVAKNAASAVLGDMVTLDDSWTGTVSLSGGESCTTPKDNTKSIQDINFNALGNANSTVEIAEGGLYGYLYGSGNTITTFNPNLLLTGDLTIQNGNSSASHIFAGTISGEGNINITRTGGSPNTHTFNNDISQWKGQLVHNCSQTTNIMLTGKATAVNATIDRQSGTLNLTVDNNGNTTTFNKNVTVSKLTGTTAMALGKGVKLTLTGSTEASAISNLTAHSGGNTIELQSGATLNRISTASGGTVTLIGAGTYDMSGNFTSNVSGLNDADNWQGKVVVSGTAAGTDFRNLGNANSTIEIGSAGVTGYLEDGSSTYNADMLMTGNISLNNGYGAQTKTFAGDIQGSGNFTFAYNGKNSSLAQGWKFSGDVSQWTGEFHVNDTKDDEGTVTKTSSGTAAFTGTSAINLAKIADDTRSTLNLTISDTDQGTTKSAVTVASEIDVNSLTTNTEKGVVLNGATTVNTMTVQNGGISGSGAVTVNTNLTLNAAESINLSGSLVFGADATLTLGDTLVSTIVSGTETSYTLAVAGSITAENVTLSNAEGLYGEKFTGYKLSVQDYAGPAMLDGESSTGSKALVLTLTAPSDTPETLTTLTVNNSEGATLVNGVLTLKTVESAENAVFGDNLNITITDEAWTAIKDANTLPDEIAFSFVGADGTTFDFNDGDVTPTITINKVPTVTGGGLNEDGTIVGNYVTAYIPEPTTTTLSLLALAGLAVRRRRR